MRTLIALSLCLVGCSQPNEKDQIKVVRVVDFVDRFETEDAICYEQVSGKGISCISKLECK